MISVFEFGNPHRLKPATPNQKLINLKEKYDDLYHDYCDKCEALRNEMRKLTLDHERATRDLQETMSNNLRGTPMLYWMRSRSKYVPAIITGVECIHRYPYIGGSGVGGGLDGHVGELFVTVQVKGVSRKVHIGDICYDNDHTTRDI